MMTETDGRRTDARKTDVAVMPLRFTDHVPQMQEFLSLLGFSTNVSRGYGWITMSGEEGMVALHELATSGASHSGETSLAFEVADVDALSAQFAAAGFADKEIYDEAYGRVLNVRDPEGVQLSFDQPSPDRYGYDLNEPRPEHGIVSMALRFDPPTSPISRLLAGAGFVRLEEGHDDSWRVWRASGGGLVALHPPAADAPAGSTRLGLRTREPLADLAARLTAAGHPDVSVSDEFGGQLTVTDPDGQKVTVLPVAPSQP
jgi:hypothetical protein